MNGIFKGNAQLVFVVTTKDNDSGLTNRQSFSEFTTARAKAEEFYESGLYDEVGFGMFVVPKYLSVGEGWYGTDQVINYLLNTTLDDNMTLLDVTTFTLVDFVPTQKEREFEVELEERWTRKITVKARNADEAVEIATRLVEDEPHENQLDFSFDEVIDVIEVEEVDY